eukprot:NODE_6149_length_1700_cov_44.471074.p1 GENE.NODE_6149_length_1700_cov_44.471074~~NODE_6149_length_1700_cov_44.471074.p1  ORF type:complete len:471 (+),score=36.61 NODE_6149_length_1700_cov_44.471074:72-1484(+)
MSAEETCSDKLALWGGNPCSAKDVLIDWPIVDMDKSMRELEAVLRTGNFGSSEHQPGNACATFEKEFAEYVGCKHAMMTSSGTTALELAVAASGLQVGDEILVPALSWIATPLSIMHFGCIPIFVDVDEDGQIDLDLLTKAMGPRTHGVMVVHLHGNPIDLDKLGELASSLDLLVIQDAAQACGAMWRGRRIGGAPAGAGPIMAAFSLQQSKNVPCGEGGIFVTDDDVVAQRAHAYRSFGLSRSESGIMLSVSAGGMHRGNELAAAFGIPQLRALEGRVVAANSHMHELVAVVESLPGLRLVGLGAASCGSPQENRHMARSALHKIRLTWSLVSAGLADVSPLAFRQELMAALNAEGVEAVLWEQVPLPEHPIFASAAEPIESGSFPSWAVRDPTRYAANVSTGFAKTRNLLACSVVLFSQKRPLIAQSREAAQAMGIAIVKVWSQRHALAANITESGIATTMFTTTSPN